MVWLDSWHRSNCSRSHRLFCYRT